MRRSTFRAVQTRFQCMTECDRSSSVYEDRPFIVCAYLNISICYNRYNCYKCYYLLYSYVQESQQAMQSTVDVAIVGGGVIGCAIAYYLSKAGVDIAVFDRGEIGAEASSAATGLLAPLGPLSGPGPYADLLLSSFALFQHWCLNWRKRVAYTLNTNKLAHYVSYAIQNTSLDCANACMPGNLLA